MEKTVFVKLRHRVQVHPNAAVSIGDVAQLIASDDELIQQLKKLVLYQVKMSDKNIVIIDLMRIVKAMLHFDASLDIQTVGPSQTIVEVVFKKRTFSGVYFALIWLLLFIGSALAIMNFHEDVSMQQVHQRLYTIITGEKEEKPLLFQIPYSIGLGLGMILFFNHVFRKRINEEPSPLEVEMFNYQQALDQYVILHENKESMRQIHDD
jgi:stage V sporulation protein AA